jgi:hypothetical protein
MVKAIKTTIYTSVETDNQLLRIAEIMGCPGKRSLAIKKMAQEYMEVWAEINNMPIDALVIEREWTGRTPFSPKIRKLPDLIHTREELEAQRAKVKENLEDSDPQRAKIRENLEAFKRQRAERTGNKGGELDGKYFNGIDMSGLDDED